jgi:hypothetical protein
MNNKPRQKGRKSFFKTIARLRHISNEIDKIVEYHQEMYQFFTKLSLDFRFYLNTDSPNPSIFVTNADVNRMVLLAQKHLCLRNHNIKKLLKLQNIAKEHSLTFFLQNKKMDKTSYFDNLI